MAKKTKTRKDKQKRKYQAKKKLPFTRKNYQIFGIGIITIIIGYIFLSIGPWDSFFSLTLAPIILIIGYLVLIPWAILHREKETKQPETVKEETVPQNIKTG